MTNHLSFTRRSVFQRGQYVKYRDGKLGRLDQILTHETVYGQFIPTPRPALHVALHMSASRAVHSGYAQPLTVDAPRTAISLEFQTKPVDRFRCQLRVPHHHTRREHRGERAVDYSSPHETQGWHKPSQVDRQPRWYPSGRCRPAGSYQRQAVLGAFRHQQQDSAVLRHRAAA